MTGVVVAGGLSGCASRVASQVTNTGASPAAVFAGDDESLGDPHVSRLTPTLSGGSGVLSGEVELEAWVTAIAMEDYNSPRSNRSAHNPIDIIDDDDDVDEDDETIRAMLELEAALQGAANDAILAISKRSARTGRNPKTGKEITEAFDEMDETLDAIRAELERCSDESCVRAQGNVDKVTAEVSHAREHVAEGQLGAAVEAIGGRSNDILVGDSLAAPGFDPSDEERDALVEYLLLGSPMVGERFTVCLPDAEVPGGNGSLAEEVTPQRLIDYVTGRAAADGKVYAWGRSEVAETAPDNGGRDCDDTDPDIHPGDVCTPTHLASAVSGPVNTGGGLRSAQADATVAVVNDPPRADSGPSVLVCPVDGEVYDPSDDSWTSEWDSESGPSSETPTVVCQVMVQPPECPVPVRGLLYVKRCRSDDQLVYTGGWVLDEAGLFEESVTALTVAGETQVVGVDASGVGDHDGDGLVDFVSRGVSRGIDKKDIRRGARIDSGTVEELVAAGVLADGEVYCWGKVSSSKAESGSCGGDEGADDSVVVTHCPLDAPVLHLVNAGSASNEVKFKAGAELSKSVN